MMRLKMSRIGFLGLMGLMILAMGLLVLVICRQRHEAAWIKAPCGEVRWEAARFPIPIYYDSVLPLDWIKPLEDGGALIDPKDVLFSWKGTLPLGTEQPLYSIVLEQWNDDGHGRTHWEVDKACHVTKMFVSLPVLMLPGKGRVRAAAHELGHGLGLGHSDWENDIMYPKASTWFPFRLSPMEQSLLNSYVH